MGREEGECVLRMMEEYGGGGRKIGDEVVEVYFEGWMY